MPRYPRACPKCGVLTAEEGFALDRHAAAGRKSHCKECDRRRRKAYYDANKDKWNAERKAAREAAWNAELGGRLEEHKKKVAAHRKQHESAERAQEKLLCDIGFWESPYAQGWKQERSAA